MDGYPKNLAPQIGPGGGVATPFEVWWKLVRDNFPTVPEEVAKYWLHEHWGHSPYSWIPSKSYRFDLVAFPSSGFEEIRSVWNNYAMDSRCRAHGKHLITGPAMQMGYATAVYMQEKGIFPTPIIVLDNRDGHVDATRELPSSYVLIEGHRRFNMALYLISVGRFASQPRVWLMTRTC